MKKTVIFRNVNFLGLTFLCLSLLICLGFVFALPAVREITMPEGYISNDSAIIQYNITTASEDLQNITFNWNNTNFTIFDKNYWVLGYNFDNRSGLGENDTLVYDISGNGNNGNVTYNLQWVNGSGHLNSGGFNFTGVGNYTPGAIRAVKMNRYPLSNATENYTLGVWIKPYRHYFLNGTSNPTSTIINLNGCYDGWLTYYGPNNYTTFAIRNGSDQVLTPTANSVPQGQWSFITVTKYDIDANTHNVKLYINGILATQKNVTGIITNSTCGGDNVYIGAHRVYSNLEYVAFNGSIDDLNVWNKTFSTSEIYQLYALQLTKYNSSYYVYYSNQTFNYSSQLVNSSSPVRNWSYYLCSGDSTGENCSLSYIISQIISQKSIGVNYENVSGTIRQHFYGANTHSPSYMTSSANSSFLMNAWNYSNMSIQRKDLSVYSYYTGIANRHIEYFSNTTPADYNTSASTYGNLPKDWSEGYANDPYGRIGASSDSHSGDYSLNVSVYNSGTVYPQIALQTGSSNWMPYGYYNFTAWIKTNSSSVQFKVINETGSYTNLCAVTLPTGGNNGEWTQYNCTFNLTTQSANTIAVAIVVNGNGSNRWALIDDIEATRNGEQFFYWKKNVSGSGSDENWTTELEFANATKGIIEFVCLSTPEFLANYSTNCSSAYYCAPENATLWAQLCANKTKDWTNNGQYNSSIMFEIINEPELSAFMNLSGSYSSEKVTPYNLIYNASYWAIKEIYPNNNVCGPGATQQYTNTTLGFLEFLGNASNGAQTDCFAFHDYTDPLNTSLVEYAEKYLGNCTANGLSCPWILIDEFNVGSDIEKNTSSYAEKYEMDVANGFIGILNAYPSIVSLVLYQWTELYSYSNTSYYPEWPKKYAIINALDNETSPAYYATANFTRLCPAGSNVLNTTSDDGLIRTVACKNINHYSYIIANAGLDSRNLTLNLTNYPYNNITNIMTDEIYLKDSNNQTNVGIIDSYDVIYLSSEDDSTAPHISFSCDHSIVSFGDTLRCNCNATDSISGITSMSYDSAPLTSQLGTFSASCNATNGAGVTVSSVLSYQVIEGGLGTGGGSSSGSSFWSNTYNFNDVEFSDNGKITQELSVKNRIRLKFNNETHYIGIVDINGSSITLNVSSISQQAVLNVNDEKKFEINGDNYYDILVKLNSVMNNKANVTIVSIHETISSASNNQVVNTKPSSAIRENIESNWILLSGVVAVVIMIAGSLYFLFRKTHKSF